MKTRNHIGALAATTICLNLVGCTAENSSFRAGPANQDLQSVHQSEREDFKAIYDGISGFQTHEDGRVMFIEYAPMNFLVTVGDAEARHLAKLTQLKGLSLPMMGNELTDRGVKDLAALSELEVLMMYGTSQVTHRSFAHLASLQNLEALGLGMSSIDDEGLKHVGELHQLKFLDVTGAKISDEGVRGLKNLNRLQSLALVSTPITDASMEVMAQFPELESLDVRGCNITDDGLAALAAAPKLKSLIAFPTPAGGGKITDAGLEHLKKIQTLQELDLTGNPVTRAGIASLRAALPGCEVKTQISVPKM